MFDEARMIESAERTLQPLARRSYALGATISVIEANAILDLIMDHGARWLAQAAGNAVRFARMEAMPDEADNG